MQSKVKNSREKLIWMIAAGTAFVVLIGSIAFNFVSASTLNSELASIATQESEIEADVQAVKAQLFVSSQCRSVLDNTEEAYDNYFSAFMGWTDEFDVMINYGIFAADTVALLAIPQLAADGDDALETAKNSVCG